MNTNTSAITKKLVEDLQENMFSHINLKEYVQWPSNNNKKQNINFKSNIDTKLVNPSLDVFQPDQKDGLFWCLYVLTLGFGKYEMLGNQNFIEEKNLKFSYIELIRANKAILKMNKIKPLTELEDDLANKAEITIKTFVALCILMNVNVLIVDKRKYYEFISDENKPINIITKTMKPLKYSLDLNSSQEKIDNYRQNYFKMVNLDSNLKSIASYKTEELLEMCTKLSIDLSVSNLNKKRTKKDLYELIIINF